MQRKPSASYFIDYPPTTTLTPDLVERVRTGVMQAQSDGYDLVFIVEDDDYYQNDYFNRIPEGDFIGSQKTTYYNLRNRSYQEWEHPKRSSLFLTGFRISALAQFEWPDPKEVFLDLDIWRYAIRNNRHIGWREVSAIGIKHGIGLCGGKGHVQRNKYNDLELEWLKANVDSDAYVFYKSLKLN